MSRWLKNVGNFLDQLDNKAADAVTAAVAGRNRDDDYDDDDDLNYDGGRNFQYLEGTDNNEDAQLLHLYQPSNTTTTVASFNTQSLLDSDLTDPNSDDNIIQNVAIPSEYVGIALVPPQQNDDQNEILGEGWDDKMDITEEDISENPIEISPEKVTPSTFLNKSGVNDGYSGTSNDTNEESNPKLLSGHTTVVESLKDATEVPFDDTSSKMDGNSIRNDNMEAVTSTQNNNQITIVEQPKLEEEEQQQQQLEQYQQRILDLEQEVQKCYLRVQKVQQEKHQEVQIITKEARTLRRHLATLNEQLAAADKEVGAQRVELDNAAQRLENDQIKYKQDLQALQIKQNNEIQALSKSHQETVSSIQLQAQNQMDALKKEITELRLQRQKEGGDWHKELEDAIQREKVALVQCQTLHDEKDALIAQIDTLRLQQEALGSQLESLTAIADNAAIREREAEIQLDNAMTLHAKQISQRQAREADLERNVAELSALLVVERSRNHNMVHNAEATQSAGDTTSSSLEYNNQTISSIQELELAKSQLDIERQRNASLRRELDEVVNERHEETLANQTRIVQYENKVSELTQQVLDLRASARDAKQLELSPQQLQQKSDEAKHNAQRIQELTDELVRMRDRISVSNSETSALRNRLQAALNRAIVAEAAAESSSLYAPEPANMKRVPNNSTDPEQGFSVRRRGANNRATNIKGQNELPSIRKALRLDTISGDGRSSQSIGKGLDLLDGFLAQSGEILRFNPIARLFFVLYLLLLHFWTFILLMFHAHGFESIHDDFRVSGAIPHGPGALMQPAVTVTAPTGN